MAENTKPDKGIIEYIEGIGEIRGKKLIEVGVKTLEDLRKIDIQEVANKTGISDKLLTKYVAMAKLQQIEGIDKQYAEALVLMGADSFSKLASMNPEVIIENMQKYDREDIIPQVPALYEVMKWQEESIKQIVPDPIVKYGSVSVSRHSSDKVVFVDKELQDIPDGVTLSISKIYKRKPLVRLTCFSHQYIPAPGFRVIDRVYVGLEDIPANKKLLDKLTVRDGKLVDDLPEPEKLGLLAQQFPRVDLLRNIIFKHHMVVETVGKNKIKVSKPEYRLCDELKNKMLKKIMREVRRW